MLFEFSILESWMIYIIIIVSSVFFMRQAELSQNRIEHKIYLLFVFVVITVPEYFRFHTGFDCIGYSGTIEHILQLNSFEIARKWYSVENSFIALTLFLKNPIHIIGFYAFFTQLFILMGIWQQRKRVSPSWVLFIYMMLEYLSTYNTFRQWLAMAIIFWAVRFAEHKQFIRYLFCCIIAAQFHSSAYIAICLYWFIGIVQKENVTMNNKKNIIAFFPLWATIVFQLLFPVISRISYLRKYIIAYGNGSFQLAFNIGLMLEIIQAIIVYNALTYKVNQDNQKPYSSFVVFNLWRINASFCMYMNMFGRSMCYFSIFGLFSIAAAAERSIDDGNPMKMTKTGFIIACLCIWRFVRIMFSNGYGHMPLQLMF